MAYVHRIIEENIIKTGKSFPCLVIYGPRQVGKSTTVEMLYGESFRKVTLDNINDRVLANQNPKTFLETYGWPLIIDEIQKAPGLLDEIKQKIDEQRLIWLKNGTERQLMYILTGSNQFELQQGVSDSLAGRCGIINMASFSQAEKYNSAGTLFDPDIELLLKHEREVHVKYRTRAEIFSDIFQGGMPDVVTGISQRDVYYRSYVNTYIEK